jgi:cathepsin X
MFRSVLLVFVVAQLVDASIPEWQNRIQAAKQNARPPLRMAKTMRVSVDEVPFPVRVVAVKGRQEDHDERLPIRDADDKQRSNEPKMQHLTKKYSYNPLTLEHSIVSYSVVDLSSSSSSSEEEERDSRMFNGDSFEESDEQGKWEPVNSVRPMKIEKAIVSPAKGRRNLRTSCLKKSGKVYEQRTYPRSYEFPGFEASLPREWDWRDVNGMNFCSPTRNQHIPVYCGSCWVFGSLGSLNDRFNVARKNRWPMTMLSPQEIIDCNGKGSCQGGEVGNVYEHAKVNGLVEEGCNNYKAVNGKCDPFHRCGTCWPNNCYGLKNYTRYYIHDYGKLSGRENMMAEIHNRGPIACGIGATEPFDMKYTGGIYSEYSDTASNHIVSVTGWGYDKDTKTEYWIVRNSWGEAWGERGWFRIVTSLYNNGRGDLYNLGIERECYFADPDVRNLD